MAVEVLKDDQSGVLDLLQGGGIGIGPHVHVVVNIHAGLDGIVQHIQLFINMEGGGQLLQFQILGHPFSTLYGVIHRGVHHHLGHRFGKIPGGKGGDFRRIAHGRFHLSGNLLRQRLVFLAGHINHGGDGAGKRVHLSGDLAGLGPLRRSGGGDIGVEIDLFGSALVVTGNPGGQIQIAGGRVQHLIDQLFCLLGGEGAPFAGIGQQRKQVGLGSVLGGNQLVAVRMEFQIIIGVVLLVQHQPGGRNGLYLPPLQGEGGLGAAGSRPHLALGQSAGGGEGDGDRIQSVLLHFSQIRGEGHGLFFPWGQGAVFQNGVHLDVVHPVPGEGEGQVGD